MTETLEKFFLFGKRWLPALIWMAIILFASLNVTSAGNTQNLLKPFLSWFDSKITNPTVQEINVILRKVMHVAQFAILAVLVWHAHRRLDPPDEARNFRAAGFVLLVAIVFAAGSELIQYYMKDREASVQDVLLNLGGSVLGLIGIFLAKRMKKRTQDAA